MRVLVLLLLVANLPASAETLIIGVLGGWQRYDNPHRAVRKLALRLRERRLPDVTIETVANHHLDTALNLIRKWHEDARNAASPLILYGNSFGGAAVVRLERQLDALGIPAALSIQIDSVGLHDTEIPGNVAAAANFFQHEGWALKGRPAIRAVDPARTQILGNFEYHYRGKRISEPGENWVRRFVLGTHLKLESDPEVWNAVERLILEHLPESAGRLNASDRLWIFS
jgi:hypothetical protein